MKEDQKREREIRECLEEITQYTGTDRDLLVRLVALLRPSSATNTERATARLDFLLGLISDNEAYRQGLKEYVFRVFSSRSSVRTFTELGILSAAGFFSETWTKITNQLLPAAYPEKGLMKDLYEVFPRRSDYRWVEGIPTEYWARLFETLKFTEPHLLPADDPNLSQLLNCILVLSQRITAVGIEPEIVSKMPEIEFFSSPFMVQSREISVYLERLKEPGVQRTVENTDYKHILVMLAQCEDYVQMIRKNKNKFGTSLPLTYSLLRLTQNIHRLRTFLKLVHETKEDYRFQDEATFFQQLVRAENKKHSLPEHFNQNLRYLAYQITEHAGRKGEHYITSSRKDYWKMLKSALGGGLIVGFLAIIKTIISGKALAPFGQAFLFSMNYSLGFILIHLTHSTLATKQPAMTAARVATSMDITGPRQKRMQNLVELLVRLSRTQFIAFVGNVVLAFPVAFFIAWLFSYFTGSPFADEYKSAKLIKELNPFTSLALFHAAIAGFFLFLSGLISGYYDNLNLYSRISQRIREHRRLRKLIPRKRLNAFADYIDHHLGALAGNFFLGIFLGSTGTIGFILGLPLDIRHVTFASGNFGLALASMDTSFDGNMIALSLLGIFLIGLVNFIVSFGLTTAMAMKSRNVDFKDTRLLVQLLLERFRSYPLDFFRAPRELHGVLEEPDPKNIRPLNKNHPVEEAKVAEANASKPKTGNGENKVE